MSMGNTDIFVHDLVTGKTTSLPLPKGVNEPQESISVQPGRCAVALPPQRARFTERFVGLSGDHWKSHQVTHSLIAGMRSEDMVEPYLVHYPSKDGKWTISAFVYVPFNLPRNGQHPAIVYVHGGPTSQTVNSFNRFIQHAANQGYIVIAPNYRGSTGYGKEFQQAKLVRYGWRRSAGCDRGRGLDQADRIRRSEKTNCHGRKLWRLHEHDGGDQSARSVGRGVPMVPFVNYFTEIENEDPVLREMDLATMGDPVKNKAFVRRSVTDLFCGQDQGSLDAAGGRERSAVSEIGDAAGGGGDQETRGRRGLTRSTRTRGMGSRGWRIRLTLTSACRIS